MVAANAAVADNVGKQIAIANCEANANVSEALLHGNPPQMGLKVVLLKFSRCPVALKKVLLEAAELAQCREALRQNALDIELESGAKVFVQPQHYLAVIDIIHAADLRLYPEHIVVDPELEDVVIEIVDKKIPKREKVYA